MDSSLLLHLSETGFITALPRSSPWTRLAAFESGDLVKRLLKERHGGTPNTKKSLEIAAHISQGRQYFKSAQNAESLVRPLLLYYGVLSLSRAVVLCADISSRETTLADSHGLSCVDWGGGLAKGPQCLADLEVRVTHGTFHELAKCTENQERSLIYNFDGFRTPVIKNGTTDYEITDSGPSIRFRDVLSRIPDLCDLFQTTFDELGACYPAHVREFKGVQVDYYLFRTKKGIPGPERLQKVFGLPIDIDVDVVDYAYPVGHVPGVEFRIHERHISDTFDSLYLPIKNDRLLIPYVVEPIGNVIRLSSMSLLYFVSYAVGMLVRYFPSQWAIMAASSTGSSMFPILNETMRLVEQRFPELVLEELERDHAGTVLYRHPSQA